MEDAVKRWNGPNGPICFSVYFDATHEKRIYEQACEKCMSEPVKNPLLVYFSWAHSYIFHGLAPYGVGRYCDMGGISN